MEVTKSRPTNDALERALRALSLAESATVFRATSPKSLTARAAVEAARRRIAELRTTPVTSTAGHNTSPARLEALEMRLAAAEAALNEEKS